MIASLHGRVLEVYSDSAIIEVGGVGAYLGAAGAANASRSRRRRLRGTLPGIPASDLFDCDGPTPGAVHLAHLERQGHEEEDGAGDRC